MWKKIKSNLDGGIERVKWLSSLLSDRMKIEISVVKLLYQSTEMERKRAELMKIVGERVYALKDGPDKMLKDPVITETLSRIEALDAEIEDVKKKASEISKAEA
ncbi:MAG TPA: hypothetical protein VEI96_06655 [Thermodesulfovibrionales bacterium]|nr:hypothetical protein [Thermodesulfovibrionales bacterium]